MKLYNIVFSPTGGTKKVSALLTDALEGEAANVDLTDSKQNFRTVQLTQEDIAVISVPSYGGRVPAVAVERLTMLRGQGARAVLVCVYGNRAYLEAFWNYVLPYSALGRISPAQFGANLLVAQAAGSSIH